MKKVVKLICPDCKAKFTIKQKIAIGDILECPACATEVEILSVNPLKYGELIEEK